MQNKSEEINNPLRIVKMIGVGDKGRIHKETVGVLMGIFCLLFCANRKRRASAASGKLQILLMIPCRQARCNTAVRHEVTPPIQDGVNNL